MKFLLSSKVALYGTAVVVLLSFGWFLMAKSGAPKEEFLTVSPAPFVQEVSVSGKVIAAEDVDLGFSQGGRVARVNVKVGDRVAAGAVLAELENGELRADVLQKEAALESEKAQLEALRQGTRPEEIAVAEASLESKEIALGQEKQALLEEIRDAYRSADDAVRNQTDQFISNARTADPQVAILVSDQQIERDLENTRLTLESALTTWQRDIGALSVSSDLYKEAARAQRELARVSDFLAIANALLNRAIATSATPQSTIDGYIADIASARSSVNSADSSITAAVTAQKSAQADVVNAQKNLALKKAGSIQADIDAQAAQVKAASANLENARAQLQKTIMRAPFSGIVTKMDLKSGAIASASLSAVSLVSDGRLQIESYIPEVNVALIALGDPARVTLDAYGEDVVFTARVASIDPAETVRDGVSTYRALLQFDESDARLRVGMTANVRITTDTRESVLSVPQGLVKEHEGKKYVRVKDSESVVEKEVSTGAISSLGNIEILTGLREGDMVVE